MCQPRHGFVHDVEAIGILVRKGSQNDVIDDAEDRRVRADADRQRQHCRDREPWRAPQASKRVAEIVEEGVHQDARHSRKLPA